MYIKQTLRLSKHQASKYRSCQASSFCLPRSMPAETCFDQNITWRNSHKDWSHQATSCCLLWSRSKRWAAARVVLYTILYKFYIHYIKNAPFTRLVNPKSRIYRNRVWGFLLYLETTILFCVLLECPEEIAEKSR